MGAAISHALRQRIIAAYREGRSPAELARHFRVSYPTARVLCRRYDAEGDAGLIPRYARCGQTGLRSDRLLYRAACSLKRRHPRWGAPFIRLLLAERYPDRRIPAVRTMQSWFKAGGLTPPRSKPPTLTKQWARAVHEVWQVDAKEHQQMADAASACWLTLTDEHSTAVIDARVFPPEENIPGAAGRGAGRAGERL